MARVWGRGGEFESGDGGSASRDTREAQCRAVEEFLADLLGEDWECQFILGGACVGSDATVTDLLTASHRALDVARHVRPDVAWTGDQAKKVVDGWWALYQQRRPRDRRR